MGMLDIIGLKHRAATKRSFGRAGLVAAVATGCAFLGAAGQSALGASLDRSGRPQVGTASFYADRYAGRAMANGRPMSLSSNNAASLTLPLGTTARVTNLATGRSAIVTIEDRGPYVKGRIVDLSPATARLIGLNKRQGLTRVEVTPLTVPMPDGSVKTVTGASKVAARRSVKPAGDSPG